MDYGFIYQDKVYTPNGTPAITPAESSARNSAIESAELAEWSGRPDRFLAYYMTPAEHTPEQGGRPYRRAFGVDCAGAVVQTWLGTRIGRIVSARVFSHNFGWRHVAIRVQGTNGAEYYGRASWDGGDCVVLRKVKGGRS